MTTRAVGFRNLVEIDFQGTARPVHPLTEHEGRELAVQAFPMSVPVGYREQGGFEGVKVYRSDDAMVISRFRDTGAVDDWGRAVLSARVALMEAEGWSRWGRDPFLWCALLDDALGQGPPTMAAMVGAEKALRESPVELGPNGIGAIVAMNRFGTAFLASALHAAIVSQNVAIVEDDAGNGEALMAVLLALLPASCLAGAFCSRCADTDAMSRERLVLTAVRPPAPRKSGFLGRFRAGGDALDATDLCVIVPAEQSAPSVRSRQLTPACCRAVVEEALRTNTWGRTPDPDRHQALVGFLDAMAQGRRDPAGSAAAAAGLGPDGANALARLSQRAGHIGAR